MDSISKAASKIILLNKVFMELGKGKAEKQKAKPVCDRDTADEMIMILAVVIILLGMWIMCQLTNWMVG